MLLTGERGGGALEGAVGGLALRLDLGGDLAAGHGPLDVDGRVFVVVHGDEGRARARVEVAAHGAGAEAGGLVAGGRARDEGHAVELGGLRHHQAHRPAVDVALPRAEVGVGAATTTTAATAAAVTTACVAASDNEGETQNQVL